MLTFLNKLAAYLTDPWVMPFRGAHPWLALLSVSFFVGLVATLGFRWVGKPEAIQRARDRLLARVLEIRIYKDDILGIFGIMGRVVLGAAVYLKQTLLPFAVLLPPILVVLVHSHAWFSYQPYATGSRGLLSVKLERPVNNLVCTSSPHLSVEDDPFSTVDGLELEIPFRAQRAGLARLELVLDEERITKRVAVGEPLFKWGLARHKAPATHYLENPAEPPLDRTSVVHRMELHAEDRVFRVAGYSVHWVVALFVLSIAFGLILRKPIGAQF